MTKTTTKKAVKPKASDTVPANTTSLTKANALIKSSVSALKSGSSQVCDAALYCLNHARLKGDVRQFKSLYEALGTCGTRIGPQYQKALLAWLTEYTPIRRNNSSKPYTRTKNGKEQTIEVGGFAMLTKSSDKYGKWDTNGAESVPFLDFLPAKKDKVSKMAIDNVQKRIATLYHLIAEHVENGTWEGENLTKSQMNFLRKLGNVEDDISNE